MQAEIKLILVGDSGVGKSSLLRRLVDGRFDDSSPSTIGMDFALHSLNVPPTNEEKTVLIWDTAGSERFRSITTSYYRGTDVALLVYDVTNPESLNDLSNTLRDLRRFEQPERPCLLILVGNKSDQQSAVTKKEVQAFIEAHAEKGRPLMKHLLVSAADGKEVANLFLSAVTAVTSQREKKESVRIDIAEDTEPPTSVCCR